MEATQIHTHTHSLTTKQNKTKKSSNRVYYPFVMNGMEQVYMAICSIIIIII